MKYPYYCVLCKADLEPHEVSGHKCQKQIDAPATARKDDSQKPRMDLIPPEAMEALATILKYGASKYGNRNWETGMKWGRVFGAAQRHLWAWMRGEKDDPESGHPHLWHALCGIAFLVAYESRGIGEDDRGKSGNL
jgi:hypothetical protein